MKKLSFLLGVLLFFPLISQATVAVPWLASSTDAGYIQPNPVNGNNPYLKILSIGTSTFSNGINLMNGCVAVSGTCLSFTNLVTSVFGRVGAVTAQSGDYSAFYQPIGNYITALTGDGTASGPGSAAFTLATVNSNVGSFTNANITVNAKGLITSAANGSSSGSGTISTSSPLVSGQGVYATGASTVASVATSTPSVGGPITYSGTFGSFFGGTSGSFGCTAASGSANGCLSSTDWTTFNNKQPAGTYVTAISVASANGFAGSSSGGVTPALTLSTSITGVLKGNGTAISAASNGTDFTLNTAKTCSVGDFVSAVTAAGVFTCTTPAGTTYTATYPVTLTGSAFGLAFGTTTSNTWAGTQTFTNNPVLGSLSGLISGNSGSLYASATSTLTASSPLTGSFIQVGSGGALGIQAASGSQNGYLSSADYSLLHTATTTFSSPLVYTLSTNAVTCPTCYTGSPVTSVTGTYPIISSGGATPAISTAFGTTTSNVFAGTQTFTNAPIFSSLSGVLLGNGSSALTAATTQTCTNQFVRALSSAYIATCNSVSLTADVTGILPEANGGTNANLTTAFGFLYTSGGTTVASSTLTAVSFNATSTTATSTFAAGISTTYLNLTGIVASSTFAQGINLTKGCFAINGTCLTSGGTLPTGTAGQTLSFVGTTLTATSTVTVSSASNVGIASTTPFGLLSVQSGDIVTASTSIYKTPGTYTWTPPSNVSVTVYVWGGGGGGAQQGGGGGSGAYVTTTISTSTSLIIKVAGGGGGGPTSGAGAGGTGLAAGAAGVSSLHGGAGGGGSSAFGYNIIACGGGGGAGNSGPGTAASGTSGGTGATGSGGGNGGGGGCATAASGVTGGTGGTSATGVSSSGGAGGGGASSGFSGNGGSPSVGVGGSGSGGASPGADGTGKDSGGGGSTDGGNGGTPGAGGADGNTTGGTGGNGEVYITYTVSPISSGPLLLVGNIFNADLSVLNGSLMGIGTTTPFASESIVAPVNTIPQWIQGISGGVGKLFQEIDVFGHLKTGGASPTCGTGCTSVSGDDRTMRVVTGTSAASVTVNFANSYTQTPVCITEDESGTASITDSSSTPTTVVITLSAGITAKNLAIICQISNNFTF